MPQDGDAGLTHLAYVGTGTGGYWLLGEGLVGGGSSCGRPAAGVGAVVPACDKQSAHLAFVKGVLSEIVGRDISSQRARAVVVEMSMHAGMGAPTPRRGSIGARAALDRAEDTRVGSAAAVAPG